MLVDCAHYKDGCRQNDEPLAIDEAAARSSEDDGFVWLGLHDPTPDELLDVGRRFDLPPLAVEDAMHKHQRPKIEDYDNGYFLVLHTARYIDSSEEVEFGEVHVFTGLGYVIVVRHGAASELHSARERLEHKPELLRLGPTAAVWAVTDKVVDDYQPVVEGIENDVEEVEEAVFEGGGDQTRRIYALRRELAEFYRAVHPLMTALDTLAARSREGIPKLLRNHLRDVEDHLAAHRGGGRDAARRAGEHLPGEPRRHQPAAERGRAQDLRLGGDHRRADVHGEHLGHELQAHARALVALRLPAGAGADGAASGTALCLHSAARPLAVARSRDATPEN